MSTEKRLIDANKLKADIENSVASKAVKGLACGFIESAPTVDAVEVVRCKDCKHYMEYPLNKVDKRMCCYVHLLTPHFMLEDGFCSYGERRTDHV